MLWCCSLRTPVEQLVGSSFEQLAVPWILVVLNFLESQKAGCFWQRMVMAHIAMLICQRLQMRMTSLLSIIFLQPLDRAVFKSLKAAFGQAQNRFMKTNPSLTRLQFGGLLLQVVIPELPQRKKNLRNSNTTIRIRNVRRIRRFLFYTDVTRR